MEEGSRPGAAPLYPPAGATSRQVRRLRMAGTVRIRSCPTMQRTETSAFCVTLITVLVSRVPG